MIKGRHINHSTAESQDHVTKWIECANLMGFVIHGFKASCAADEMLGGRVSVMP
ncbi:MAG: hypothetical protein QXY01_01640 [Candidatus Bathyarchaeia archaeon]